MAAKPPAPPAPRLYLATPVIEDPAALVGTLPALLGKADVAAVLLRLAPSDPRSLTSHIKAIAQVAQNADAALLVEGHADLVARGGADGAHLPGLAPMQEALPALKPDWIAGCGGLTTRHHAMSAGEAGADYVLFGEPDTKGQRPSADAIAERVEWWAELFEPPCVAYAATLAEAEQFAAAGADFVLVGDLVWNDQRGAATALAEVEQAIKQGHAALLARFQAAQG
ncbi:thiamine phosphate synthase [Tardiphaga sp.]|uniref:thiamine phosphate synthase n=1 Tax=Tardiphaga sp. TaxID=1926292 RepID=UPI0037D9EB28